MSVPEDKLMELMRNPRSSGGGQPSGVNMPGMGMFPTPSDAETPPTAAPMSTPEPKMGSREAAMINLSMAMDLLEQSLPALGSESEEGQKAIRAITVLNGILGQRKSKVDDLQQSEILQMLQTLPKAGGATPEANALAKAPLPGMPQMGGQPPMM